MYSDLQILSIEIFIFLLLYKTKKADLGETNTTGMDIPENK